MLACGFALAVGGLSLSGAYGVYAALITRSEDLVTWTSAPLDEMIFNRSNAQGFYTTYYWGAPKMFYDKDRGQYIISWHACNDPDKDDWDSMRTLYVLTKDFETYTEPQKLFNFTGADENMAIIDAIIRKVNGKHSLYGCPFFYTL